MSRMTLEDVVIFNPVIKTGMKYGIFSLTTNAATTLDRDAGPLCIFVPTGAFNLTLPTAEAGLFYIIHNAAASALAITVKNPAAATIATVAQNANAMIYSDGTNWYGA